MYVSSEEWQVTTRVDQEADDNMESSVVWRDWKERSEDRQCKTKFCNAGAGAMLNEDQLMQVQNELVN